MTTPRLFPDLRAALSCLYSLPSNTHEPLIQSSDRAHEFLLHLQTRNVRRKLDSIRQSGRDQSKSNQANDSTTASTSSNKLADEVQGSTWLACLAVLSCAHAEYAERLFAAQTLMHRLRRVKLSEAIDLEMEDPNKYLHESSSLQVNLRHLATDYVHWMSQFHPLLASLLKQFLSEHPIANDTTNEEQLKGELTMLTIAAITYLTATTSNSGSDNIHPLLVTLGNCLASTALRLRYTPQSVSLVAGTLATPTSAPIVTMMLQSLSASLAVGDSNNADGNNAALFSCLCACLSVVPEALLSSGGGAMGRISIDPRCVQAAHEELRQPSTGVYLVWEALHQQQQPCENEKLVQTHLLDTLQSWAKCLPLPQDFIDYTAPLAGQLLISSSEQSKMAALSYLIAIYESGSVTAKHILQFSLGISSDQLSGGMQPTNKKRQTSRAKKRQQERLDDGATDDLRLQAQDECRHRGAMACRTTRLVWEGLAAATRHALLYNATDLGGEGPVGCLCACANACLPHWLRNASSTSAEDVELASAVMNVFQEICSHTDRSIRSLAYESLYNINSALLAAIQERHNHSPARHPSEMETAVASHLYQCTMRLATSCGYGSDYFDDFAIDNDEEVEVERNEARDLIRAVSGCEGDIAKGETSLPRDLSMSVLSQIVQSVTQACDAGAELPAETAVHALSALAKPLNALAGAYTNGYRCEGISETLLRPILALRNIQQCMISAFGTVPLKVIFPLSRLANLAAASFSPALSALCELASSSSEVDRNFSNASCEAVQVSVHAAALSIVNIPELAAESTLDHTQYDIRGAMRTPGGEDHAGCIALMRLAFESDELARVMLAANKRNANTSSLPLELCNLHEQLKSLEIERGPSVLHGVGVTPKSRRILCQTICRLVVLGNDDDDADREATTVLSNLFQSLIASVVELTDSSSTLCDDAERINRITEGVLDIAAFSPSMIGAVFADSSGRRFIQGVVQTCQLGFAASTLSDDVIFQWARLRIAMVGLLKASASPDVPDTAREAIVFLNQTECQAMAHFHRGPPSDIPIFSESAVSDAGIFVHLLGEIIEKQQGHVSPTNCVEALQASRSFVFETFLSRYPEPTSGSFIDPRTTLCEAWYLSLSALIGSMSGASHTSLNDDMTSLLSESCSSAFLLFMYPSLRKGNTNKSPDMGMSLDGPQTRAILVFLERYFLLGSRMLRAVAMGLRERIGIDVSSIHGAGNDEATQGLAILGACLFRAASGGLPPWAIEVMPSLSAALFVACGNDADIFCKMLDLAMDVRLSEASNGFGAVLPGHHIAGYYIATAKPNAKATFLIKSREACRENNANGWRRFKTLLKQICGGKKKSSLSLKPAFTTWDLDRP